MNRRMNKEETAIARAFLDRIRDELKELARDDRDLLFAMRRRIYIRLMHDERGTPVYRRKLKALKWEKQQGLCAICGKEMPLKHSELDRTKAFLGYTGENTRLVHHECHVDDQRSKNFSDKTTATSEF